MTRQDRSACKAEKKATLARLRLTPAATDDNAPAWPGDDFTFRWIAATCGHCGACPKFMAKRGFKLIPRLAVVSG